MNDVLLNLIVGFVIPWIFGIMLFRRNPKTVLIFAPVASAVSSAVDSIGLKFGYWKMEPAYLYQDFVHLPIHLGFFPVVSCYMLHFIQKNNRRAFFLILLFTLFSVSAEWIALYTKRLLYFQGWNIYVTAALYFIMFAVGYSYYLIVIKYMDIKNQRNAIKQD